MSRIYEFLPIFGAAEKNEEKIEATCTGFSTEFFGSHVLFYQKNKSSNFQLLAGACHLLGSLFLNPYDFTKTFDIFAKN